MEAGRVETLFILGSNPVYTAPADLRFAERLQKVKQRVHLGLHHDETAALCQWHVPEAHYLESWGDARAADGTVTVDPAADRAAARRAHGARDPGRPRQAGRADRARDRAGLLAGAAGAEGGAAFEQRGAARCTTASCPAPLPRRGPSRSRRLVDRVGRAPAAPGPGDPVPSRPHRVRRALRQQRAGSRSCRSRITKLTWDNAALVEPVDGRAAWGRERGRGRAALPWPPVEGAGLGAARAGGRHGHRAPGLRPTRGGGRVAVGPGFDAVPAADQRGAVGRARARGGEDRRAPTSWPARRTSR